VVDVLSVAACPRFQVGAVVEPKLNLEVLPLL
jgi:hypothetical protein